jgi:hypothetical protein
MKKKPIIKEDKSESTKDQSIQEDFSSLDAFINRLKQKQVEFYTRFQEDEWGCRYMGNGKFLKWSSNYMQGSNIEEEFDEEGITKVFSIYKVENLWKMLIVKV